MKAFFPVITRYFLRIFPRLCFMILSIASCLVPSRANGMDESDTTDLSHRIAADLNRIMFPAPAPVGETFTEIASLTGISQGDMEWGDYDNDGDLDVLVTGLASSPYDNPRIPFTKLFRNDLGTFSEDEDADFFQFDTGAADWGDYDNDGDLDLLLTGYTGLDPLTAATFIYKNSGGSFTLVPGTSFLGAGYSTCHWVDLDNDGDLDIYVTGWVVVTPGTTGATAKLYRNNGDDVFGEFTYNTLGVANGDIGWADYDNDMDMDVLVTSLQSENSMIWQNNLEQPWVVTVNLIVAAGGAAIWGDFDNDGDQDVIISGQDYPADAGIIRLYKNDGSGALTSAGASGLIGHYESSMTAGDYDSDGDLDLLLTGFTSPSDNTNTKLFNNDGTGNFTQATNTGLGDEVRGGEAKFADYDNDGDPDLILSGTNSDWSARVTKIYRNDLTVTNTKPTAPTGLSFSQTKDEVIFSWDPATDAEGGTLTYNLRVGTTPGGSEIVASHSDPVTGFHRIAEPGNVLAATSWRIKKLTQSQYYWSVQAIDHTGLGGNFSSEASPVLQLAPMNFAAEAGHQKVNLSWTNPNSTGHVVIYRETSETLNPTNIIAPSATGTSYTDMTASNGTQYYYYIRAEDDDGNFSELKSANAKPAFFSEMQSLALSQHGTSAWGDYDADGDYDLMVTGFHEVGPPSVKLYNNVGGTFTQTAGPPLTGGAATFVSFNDYDNDNDLDILIAGAGETGAPLHKNTAGVFSLATGTNLLPADDYKHAWADYDNDGDQDLIVPGFNLARMFRNDRTSGFAEVSGLPQGRMLAWGDYDQDGDMDYALTGGAFGLTDGVYTNNNGSFTKTALDAMIESAVAWVDIDKDADLDLVISGKELNGTSLAVHVHRNNSGTFVEVPQPGITPFRLGHITTGDYDNDGDMDLLFTGITHASNFESGTRMYLNDGTGTFTEDMRIEFPHVTQGNPLWCDYDADGDLDLVIMGLIATPTTFDFVNKVFRNNLNTPNTAPTTPSNLNETALGSNLTLNWNASTDAQGGSVMYNLRVGTTPNGAEVLSAMAINSSGKLLIPTYGNVQFNRSWTLKNLQPGTYYWSVQAIDGAYASSAFATEQQAVVPDFPATTGIENQTIAYGEFKELELEDSFTGATLIFEASAEDATIAGVELTGSKLKLNALKVGTTQVTVAATNVSTTGQNSTTFSVTVNRALLEISADNKSKVYQEPLPALTATFEGFKFTDTQAVITPAPALSTTATQDSPAGTYPITVSAGATDNYTITVVDGTLTVSKAQASVTITDLEKDFNQIPQTPTVTTDPPGLTVALTFNGSTNIPTAAGTYDVVATVTDANYEGTASATFIINNVVGVEDGESELTFYPNPVADELVIQSRGITGGRAEIRDMLGRVVTSARIQSERTILDCREMNAGVGLLVIYDNKGATMKVAKVVRK